MTSDARPAGAPVRPARRAWVLDDITEIHAVLSDQRFGVPPAPPGAPAGTVAWLRAAVPRFSNGAVHEHRRAAVSDQLSRLEPPELRAAARERARARLARGAGRRGPAEMLSAIARHVPAATLAAQFGVRDPDRTADVVADLAAGYFPGSDEAAEQAADRATQSLTRMLASSGQEVAMARMAILVQACDATAKLIVAALDLLAGLPDGSLPTDVLLAETARRRPPVPAIRRVALAPVELAGRAIAAGDTVTCDVAAVSRAMPGGPGQGRPDGSDSAQATDPGQARPDGSDSAQAALTFGYGRRPCPGPAHALALAAGVVDAARAGAAASGA